MTAFLSRFFAGEARFFIGAPAHKAAELFILTGIPVHDCTPLENGLEVTCERKDKHALHGLCSLRGYPCRLLWEKGFVPFLKRAIRRPGLLLGAVLALFMLWQSANYVWDIDVVGNKRLKREEVTSLLRESGFFIGSRHTRLDLHELCNRIPIENEDIAWISINIMGGRAEVQIIEQRNKREETETAKAPVNLVASADGQIVRYELSSGRAVASVGQTVREGQLLVAGFSESESGLHPRVSSGKVFARVMLFEETFAPYTVIQKTGEETVLLKKSVNISGREIFFYKNGRQFTEEYDTIKKEYRPTVFGTALPFLVCEEYAVVPVFETVTRTGEEALEDAKSILLEKLLERGAQILSRSFHASEKEDGVRVLCQAECIIDIARPSEVKIVS